MKKIVLYVTFIIFKTMLGQKYNHGSILDIRNMDAIDFDVFKSDDFKKYYNKTYDITDFKEKFFQSWDEDTSSITCITDTEWKDYFSYHGISEKSPCYSGNYQIYTDDLVHRITNNLPEIRSKFPHIEQKAIIVDHADLRGLPTTELCFKNYHNAGEGYPFDYLQYSSLAIGTPVLILSASKDGVWYFVHTPNNKGWVLSEKVALVSDKQSDKIKKMSLVTVTSDHTIVRKKEFCKELMIGTILPTMNKSIYIPIRKNINGMLDFIKCSNEVASLKKFPIAFNKDNVQHILTELYNSNYGWGGLNKGRDCSSTLKDYLTPFGIYLPRNSEQQSTSGKVTELSENKEDTILEEGVPFLSAIYKKGHIMLYVGKDRDTEELLLYHNKWGFKNNISDESIYEVSKKRKSYEVWGMTPSSKIENEVQTRIITGKTIITTLEPLFKKTVNQEFKKLYFKQYLNKMVLFGIDI